MIRYSACSSLNARNSSLKSGLSAMLKLLDHYDHFPSCAEDCLVALPLPKLDIKSSVGKPVPNHSRLPDRLRSVRHLVSISWLGEHATGTAVRASLYIILRRRLGSSDQPFRGQACPRRKPSAARNRLAANRSEKPPCNCSDLPNDLGIDSVSELLCSRPASRGGTNDQHISIECATTAHILPISPENQIERRLTDSLLVRRRGSFRSTINHHQRPTLQERISQWLVPPDPKHIGKREAFRRRNFAERKS